MMSVTRQAQAPDCCAVILAGGRNSRMAGRHKAFIPVGGRPIIDRLTDTFHLFFNEIIVVTRQPDLFADRSLQVVGDLYEARTSLTGIHAGLTQASSRFAMVVPCDVPFLQPDLVRLLIDEIDPSCDVVIPFIRGFFEPLCAIYSKACLPAIEAHLNQGIFKITRFFEQVRVKTISQERVEAVDPHLRSFLNANTPDEFAALDDIAASPSGRTAS